MRQRELSTFQKLLHERRLELLGEAVRTVDGMGEGRELFPDPTGFLAAMTMKAEAIQTPAKR